MARVTDSSVLDGFPLGLTLDRYQEIMRLPIAAFNGLNNPNEYAIEQCSTIWKQSSRDDLATWLAVAEERRETELGYFLSPKYTVDEEQQYTSPVILNQKKLIQLGVEATTDIEGGVALTHRDMYYAINDPVEISVTTTVTDTDEICVYYPDEDIKIRPSSVTISGGTATIKIPRSRLVDPDYLDDRSDPLDYNDDDNFLTAVDVKRCYTSIATAVDFAWTSVQLAYYGRVCPANCSEVTQAGCGTITGVRAYRTSQVTLFPATFSGETPSGAHFTYGFLPQYVRVSYLSGQRSSPNHELLTARYAHTLMANTPCSCPYVEQYWQNDRKDADFVTPYGNTQGAQAAWMADSRAKIGVGGMMR